MHIHGQFDHAILHDDDANAAKRVSAIDAALTLATAHLEALTRLSTTLQSALATAEASLAQERGDTRGLHARIVDLREALAQLERGVAASDATLPEVSPFLATAGLAMTRASIADLTAMRDEWLQRRDHDNDVGTYRLLPDVGPHFKAPGVRLFAGETIELTRRAARRFEDKFVPVERSPDQPAGSGDASTAG